MKPENIFVEFIFRRAIMYHETSMNHTKTGWRRIRRIAWLASSNAQGLNKAYAMPLWINDGKEWSCRFVFLARSAGFDFVFDQISLQLADIVRGEGDFFEEI